MTIKVNTNGVQPSYGIAPTSIVHRVLLDPSSSTESYPQFATAPTKSTAKWTTLQAEIIPEGTVVSVEVSVEKAVNLTFDVYLGVLRPGSDNSFIKPKGQADGTNYAVRLGGNATNGKKIINADFPAGSNLGIIIDAGGVKGTNNARFGMAEVLITIQNKSGQPKDLVL